MKEIHNSFIQKYKIDCCFVYLFNKTFNHLKNSALNAEQQALIEQSINEKRAIYNSELLSLLYADTLAIKEHIQQNGLVIRLTRAKLDKLLYRTNKILSGEDLRFIYHFLSLFNYTVQSFADSIGFSRIYVTNIMQGKANISGSFQDRVLNTLPLLINRIRLHRETEPKRYITDIKYIHTFAKLFNLSIKELALKLNVTKEYLGRVLLGHNPLSETLQKRINDNLDTLTTELIKSDLYGDRLAFEAIKMYLSSLPPSEKLSDDFIQSLTKKLDSKAKEELIQKLQSV